MKMRISDIVWKVSATDQFNDPNFLKVTQKFVIEIHIAKIDCL